MGERSSAEKPSLIKNTFLNFFYQLLVVIAPFITAPYISRVLQPAGVGVYSYTTSLVQYFVLVAALGTHAYGTREIALHRSDKAAYSKSFWEITILCTLTSAISLSIWIVLAILYKEYQIYLLILGFQILATALDISWLYTGLEKFEYTIPVNALVKILSIVLVFVFVKSTSDVWVYILIMSGAMLFGNLAMWVFLPKVLAKTKIESSSLKNHLRETLIYFVPSIATTIYTVLDKTLIGVLIPGTTTVIEDGQEVVRKVSEIENGFYEQATKIVTILKTASFVAINGVMGARANYLFGKHDNEGIKKLGRTTLNLTSFLSIGSAFGICAICSVFIPAFFGPGYERTVTLLYIMALLVPIICFSNVIGSIYYTPTGRRKQSALFLIIGSIINLGLNIPLIMSFYSIGAAIASVIAELIIAILYFAFCKGFLTLKDVIRILWKKVVAGAVMFGAVFTLCYFLQNNLNRWALLIISISVGVAVYVGVITLLRDPSAKETIGFFKEKFKKGGAKKASEEDATKSLEDKNAKE